MQCLGLEASGSTVVRNQGRVARVHRASTHVTEKRGRPARHARVQMTLAQRWRQVGGTPCLLRSELENDLFLHPVGRKACLSSLPPPLSHFQHRRTCLDTLKCRQSERYVSFSNIYTSLTHVWSQQWTRLIRFVAAETARVHIGQPVDAGLDGQHAHISPPALS